MKIIKVIIMNKNLWILLIATVSQIFTCKTTFAQTAKDEIHTFSSIDTLLLNPSVGFYKWNGQEQAPFKSLDSYERYNWSVFEKSEGVYDFSILQAAAEKTYHNPIGRGKFSFAIRCVVQGTNKAYPDYLDSKMNSWYSNKKKCTVPDWNSPYFLERLDSLVAALGRTFNNDNRIGYVEIRSYGNWGEWHLGNFEPPVPPLLPITNASIAHMIDAYTTAFPDKQLIMLCANPFGIKYAMSKTNLKFPIGWRADNWGNRGMQGITQSESWEYFKDRWKTAPVIVEGYGTGGRGMEYSYCLPQVEQYHISSIGNGNFGIWSTMTATQRDSVLMGVRHTGYHYTIRSCSMPQTSDAGTTIQIKTQWSNTGNAPTYQNWTVIYRLLDAKNGKVKGQSTSQLNLKTLLPTLDSVTKMDNPITVSDSFSLAANLKSGIYRLELIILDPSKYDSPLQLYNKDRNDNGGYDLGTIKLVSSK